uniref:Uncharacterized protein n=1 Tax=Tanacetum cinerariifolium TaxID=118510 RepID=A0A699H5T5_TANCI|nr:hypothetical protein [Tanacetum cinerariifolium]
MAKVKRVNDKEQVQALVDKTKVIITEDSIRSDLPFDDAEGTTCLLNETWVIHQLKPIKHTLLINHLLLNPKGHKILEAYKNRLRSGELMRLKKIGSDRRVKSLMEKDGLGAQEDASKQGRIIKKIDQNIEIALDDKTQGRINDDEMFRIDDLAREEVVMDSAIEPVTTVKDSVSPTIDVTEDEITMVQALAALKSIKPKIVQSQIPTVSSLKDKGKAKMIEPKVRIKKKDQMRIDEEYTRKLQAEE